jgi:pyridoxine 4-dehydrogenase
VTLAQVEAATSLTPVAAVSNAYSLDNRRGAIVLQHCASGGMAYLPYYALLGGHVLLPAPVQTAARALGPAAPADRGPRQTLATRTRDS